MWQEIKKVIQKGHSFLLTTHVNPDGDGIGSACALAELLKQMGKEVRFVCDSPIPNKFSFLDVDHTHSSYQHRSDYKDIDVLVLVDAHSRERIGRVAEMINEPGVTTIVIDHHAEKESITPYAVIDVNACSSGSMIYTLYQECGYEITKDAAMGLYVSVISDTGRFCYSSTDRKAHQIAEECMKKGVDPDWMYSHIYQQVSLSEFQVFSKALRHMEVFFDGRVIVQKILLEDFEGFSGEVQEIIQSDLEYFHEFNKIISGVDCIVLLCEIAGGQIRISLRASGDFCVDTLSRALGGGGHPKAAGANVEGTVEEVKELVLGKIAEQMGVQTCFSLEKVR